MNWLDIIIIIVIIISAFIGLWNGLIKTILSLAGSIVGVVLAGRYYVLLSEQLSFINQENVAKIVAFVIILFGVMIIAWVIASLMKWSISAIGLGWINRLSGAVFGLVLGAIFCGALLAIWVKFVGIGTPVAESGLASLLLDQFRLVLALLPGEFDEVRFFFQ